MVSPRIHGDQAMELRDHIAVEAMKELMFYADKNIDTDNCEYTMKAIAEMAYEMADLMMKQREK